MSRQYDRVPTLRKDDNVIPTALEIPGMINSLRHPRRRAISVGPQSQADAYETLALRERTRSQSSGSIVEGVTSSAESASSSSTSRLPAEARLNGPRPPKEVLIQNEQAVNDQDDDEMFAKLFVPRVRYDVEVVTKLIIYAGELDSLYG